MTTPKQQLLVPKKSLAVKPFGSHCEWALHYITCMFWLHITVMKQE